MSFSDQPPGGGFPPGGPGEGRQPTEEELRAAYEAEIKRLRVEDVIVQTVVSLINLGARKAGIAPGTEDEQDPEQLQQAIDASRALLPFVESALGPEAGQLRDALSQLQMAYARGAGGGAGEPAAPGEAPAPEQPAAAPEPPAGQEPPSRLWIPGQ
ncbi:hypothetical protein LRS13_19025 [Svornostia abyssi]|uniref:DUF1844 domain-containing protein n=1 Tax=Svornostia abyssi TaxID=2898438 RepID=A0ABY5PDP7_9ACTN|nr:hypothetical protein LRS13_19025 [Parviterribacteraceae bacterium J379]